MPGGMKKEQLEVVVAFLTFFAVLHTGLGKSLCYACLPFTFDLLGETEEKPIVVVVTPLTANHEGSRDISNPH